MSTNEMQTPNGEEITDQTVSLAKFDAVSALAKTYVQDFAEIAPASELQIRFTKFHSNDAEQWLDTQALLSAGAQEVVQVIETARFGVNGWINLRRVKDANGKLIHILQLIDHTTSKEVSRTSVSHAIVGEAICRGISPLAAALAAYPNFRAQVKKLVLKELVDATYRHAVLEQFVEDVKEKAKTTSTRI